ncbi:MAG TPA: hypothetical protein VFW00_10985 [Rhodocyclaceae bacterium]|nr:hypothetical protein [Rhodocyclaceae bacterium]
MRRLQARPLKDRAPGALASFLSPLFLWLIGLRRFFYVKLFRDPFEYCVCSARILDLIASGCSCGAQSIDSLNIATF